MPKTLTIACLLSLLLMPCVESAAEEKGWKTILGNPQKQDGETSVRYLIKFPKVFEPCSSDHHRASLGAVYLAMEDLGWSLTRGTGDYFRARACRRSHCAEIDVFLVEEGRVEIYRNPTEELRHKNLSILRDWLDLLTARYEDFTCRDPKMLEALMDEMYMAPPDWSMPAKLEKKYLKKGYFPRWFEWREKNVEPPSKDQPGEAPPG